MTQAETSPLSPESMHVPMPTSELSTSARWQRGWAHFKTLLWLRWRILRNQMAKTGQINLIITMILIWSCLSLAGFSFFIALGLGIALLPNATPFYALLIWDVLALAFFCAWMVGLITDLQRTEFLSIGKLLQLPMSFQGAFTLNYLTSLVTISVLGFVPTAIGLGLAFAIVHGPWMLLQIPAALALVFMISSVSYLFRTWLGALMQNERKRRTVVVMMTLGIVVMAQVPNLLIQTAPDLDGPLRERYRAETAALEEKLKKGELDPESYKEASDALSVKLAEDTQKARQEKFAYWERYLNLASVWIPIGWPAVISKQLMVADLRMFVMGSGGMLAIGVVSLVLSYRVTMRSLTKADQPILRKNGADSPNGVPRNWLQTDLPLLKAHPSTVMLATSLNLVRTPEAKMALLGPFIMAGVFIAIFFFRRESISIPIGLEPFLLLAAIGLIFFAASFTCMNLFGMDRNSFKSLVLMPVRRRDVLLGKNLTLMPPTILLVVPLLLVVCCLVPNCWESLFPTLLQVVTISLGTCIIGNPISIWFPIPITPGTGQPAKVNFKVIAVQIAGSMLCMLMFLPAAAGIGVEILLQRAWNINYIPVYLLIGVVELAIVIPVYRWALSWQGDLLQRRETDIIDALKVGEE